VAPHRCVAGRPLRRASLVAVTMAEAAGAGRGARWVLLFCTLFGLATMHTLGHGGVRLEDHHAHAAAMPEAGDAAAVMPGADAVAAVMPGVGAVAAVMPGVGAAAAVMPGAAVAAAMSGAGGMAAVAAVMPGADAVAAVMPHAVVAGCADCGGHRHEMSGWSVCVAVLGGLALALLIGAFLLGGTRELVRRFLAAAAGLRSPRAPPARRTGLRVASLAVLRI
jgi:hypothetical protein